MFSDCNRVAGWRVLLAADEAENSADGAYEQDLNENSTKEEKY